MKLSSKSLILAMSSLIGMSVHAKNNNGQIGKPTFTPYSSEIVDGTDGADLNYGRINAAKANSSLNDKSVMDEDEDDNNYGRIDARLIELATTLADNLNLQVNAKLNQDSTENLSVYVAANEKIEVLKAIIESNPNGAYVALSTLEVAIKIVSEIDLLEQKNAIQDNSKSTISQIRSEVGEIVSKVNILLDRSVQVGKTSWNQFDTVKLEESKLANLGLNK